ncbi:MAG TPA: glutamate--tRNA ligase [Mycobacteriales bacterium]|nr:glutamate--tRNA ligase [Mycobacteriales bacterium]
MADDPLDGVRTRFAPAPSGQLHVGNVRTALFSWATARRASGTFILRVEDTDRSRVLDEYVEALQDDLRWLGIGWDEGPIRQSGRQEHYDAALATMLGNGSAYRAFDTPEELAAQREDAAARKVAWRYDGSRWKALSAEESAAKAATDPFVVRFAMPPGSTTFTDLVRGDVTVEHTEIGDFALTRNDGAPLYYLAATVDDVLMGLTHIVRGEDLLMATPRQMAMYAALGHPRDRWPQFAHVPLIMGEDGKPLSKRNESASLSWYRTQGFLPEAVLNYLCQLGWSMPDGREQFGADEFVAAFSLDRVQRNAARFDLKKLEALNGDWIRSLPLEDLEARVLAALVDADVAHDVAVVRRLLPELASRLKRLTEAPGLLAPLLSGPGGVALDPDDALALLTAEAVALLDLAITTLEGVTPWESEPILDALRGALDAAGLKPKKVFPLLYLAVLGKRAGYPLTSAMEVIGREESLARLRTARDRAASTG